MRWELGIIILVEKSTRLLQRWCLEIFFVPSWLAETVWAYTYSIARSIGWGIAWGLQCYEMTKVAIAS